LTPISKSDLGYRAVNLILDRRLLLILFIAFRLLMVVVYIPFFQSGIERGMSAGGDYFTYFQLGALSDDGLLPFRSWWSEFPPIPSFLNVAMFQAFGRDYTTFAMAFGVLMLAFDIGNLLLLRRIGTALHGVGVGAVLSWVYALLLAPAIFIWWNFEPMVAFFLLWGLAALIDKRDMRSAVVALIGTLAKFTPALLVGVVWRFRPVGKALRYSAIVLGGFALVYLLLYSRYPANTLASLTAQFNKASYQTVWALLDGNYRTGNFGPVTDRLDAKNATRLEGNPPVVPSVVRLGMALAIGLVVFLTARRRDDRGLVAFMTLALLLFFLQAQGWSPQWLAQIAPLLLLCFPTRTGILGIVLLTGAVFIEYPFLFIRTGDAGGEITGALVTPFAVLIGVRTALLIGFCVALYLDLRQVRSSAEMVVAVAPLKPSDETL